MSTGGLAASIGGVNNDTIFFFNNGVDDAKKLISPVHSYNSSNNVWNTQTLSGIRPIGTSQMRVVTDNNGKTYLLAELDFTLQGVTSSNGLFIFYMGGRDGNYSAIPDGFKMIFLYDTINDKWDSKTTTGDFPPPDYGITTVLGLNGDKIILFGVKGVGPTYRRANVIGKYMVVTFGFNDALSAKYKQNGESDVLLLDVSNDSEYVWTTSFDPTPLAINSSSSNYLLPKPKTNNNMGIIIIDITIGIILLLIIVSIVVFLFIKRRKHARNAIIPTVVAQIN
ncbi:hypothetical protein GLOIN_2v1875867 [Rhizophagus clarus]|uniref:Uncharacterized protein n=2 Tax=Rhizophagus clarus TaxID=94130 RepID=A0A8H3QCS3_9GLOM|nr:hypothetical protein GLOIN_2v1875867 [Rhizophagus clarus]